MSDDAKYVVFDGGDNFPETVIIFPTYVSHVQAAFGLRSVLGEPVSAGFIAFSEGLPLAYGESVSLKLEARGKADTELLAKVLK